MASRLTCPVCKGGIGSGEAFALIECGHVLCKGCVPKPNQQPVQRDIKPCCPKCNGVADVYLARKVNFQVWPHDNRQELERLEGDVTRTLATNEFLNRQRTRLLADIEQAKVDHSRLDSTKRALEEGADRLSDIITGSTT